MPYNFDARSPPNVEKNYTELNFFFYYFFFENESIKIIDLINFIRFFSFAEVKLSVNYTHLRESKYLAHLTSLPKCKESAVMNYSQGWMLNFFKKTIRKN